MMIEPRLPKYEWGQPVVAAVDLYNDDGSHPEVPEDHLLIPAGGLGEIVQVGHHAEANLPVYLVDFGLAVIGVMEEEIAPQDQAQALSLPDAAALLLPGASTAATAATAVSSCGGLAP